LTYRTLWAWLSAMPTFELDHMRFVEQYLDAGIPAYCSEGAKDSFLFRKSLRPEVIQAKKPYVIGNFKIIAFNVQHDCLQPFGYVISHPESGNIVFLTDSYYSKYKFANINHYLIESNFADEIVKQRVENGSLNPAAANRLKTSHMSIDTCAQLLAANDLSKVKNIVLIHLSSRNSNAKDFQKQITCLTGKKVTVADSGIEVDFNLNSF